MKYVFLGTPPLAATILEALAWKVAPPLLVVTQTAKATGRGQRVVPSAVEALAIQKQFPYLTCDNINQPEIIEKLKAINPELILVAAFGQLLKESVLTLPSLYCLNVHASLLPKYRGAAPIQRAIWNGDKVTGVTIQRMVKKLDAGDILHQKKTEISPTETSGELMNRLAVIGAEALIESVELIKTKKATFTPQNDAEVTFAAKLQKEDAPLDWTKSATELHCQIRALQPWPIAETTLGGTKLKVFKAEVKSTSSGEPGNVKTDHKTYLDIACEQGALSLTEIQLENRKRLSVKDFLMGYRGQFPFNKVGDK